MNQVILIGQITKKPELRYSPQTQNAVCTFSLAVNRVGKQDETDFLNIVLFGKLAEAVANHKQKGEQIAIQGRIQTRSYEKEGQKRYVTEIFAHHVEFIGNRKEPQENHPPDAYEAGYRALSDDDVPF